MEGGKPNLRELDFGRVDAESEDDLVKRFVQTYNFNQISDDHTLIILGPKGSGKSAIFRLLTEYPDAAEEILDYYPSNTHLIKATGGGDVKSIDNRDLEKLRREGDFSYDEFWRVYAGLKVASKIGEQGLSTNSRFSVGGRLGSGNELSSVLRAFDDQPDWRLIPVFKSIWEAAIGKAPSSGSISYGRFSLEIGNNDDLDIDRLLEQEQEVLKQNTSNIWLLFDRIDELHAREPKKRKELLESLFTVQREFVDRYPNIRLKVFLRTDIWEELEFVNKSHVADKIIRLEWDDLQLLKLVNKRMIQSDEVLEYVEKSTSMNLSLERVEEHGIEKQKKIFYSVFEKQVYSGPKEADSFDWITKRIKDGEGGRYPRELITFCNESVKEEIKNEEHPEDCLIGGLSIRDAYFTVSNKRVNTYLSEFEDLKPHFKKFDGKKTAQYTHSELKDLFKEMEPGPEKATERMVDIGFLSKTESGDKREYEIPPLYRDGIGLVIRGRP